MALDSDDWLVFGIAIGGLYLLAQISRSQSAAAAESGGNLSFPSAAPSIEADIVGSVVPMSVSPAGIAAIQAREGFTRTPIGDAGGEEIGYGHEIQPGENFTSITQAQGLQLLQNDLAQVATVLNTIVTVPLNPNQFDALASLIYNIGNFRAGALQGKGAFQKSTLLRILNAGNYAGAAAQFARWNQSAGAVNPALVARRQSEAAQFNS